MARVSAILTPASALSLALLLALAACAGGDDGASASAGSSSTGGGSESGEASGSSGEGSSSTGGAPQSGTIDLLTYNVAGLPQGISGSDPEFNTPLISPLLNQHALVLVQEDFYYHEELIAEAKHPYISERSGDGVNDLGDGLNRLSQTPFADHARTAWKECYGQISNGSDCLAKKGFAVAEHELAPGVRVDVYNLHMDAGRDPEDMAERAAQVEQLVAAIEARSAGEAIIVAGDTNMKAEDEAILQDLLAGAGLTDACRALACGEEARIDRVFYRSSAAVELHAESWALDLSFVDGEGDDLSDHQAVAVVLGWSAPPS